MLFASSFFINVYWTCLIHTYVFWTVLQNSFITKTPFISKRPTMNGSDVIKGNLFACSFLVVLRIYLQPYKARWSQMKSKNTMWNVDGPQGFFLLCKSKACKHKRLWCKSPKTSSRLVTRIVYTSTKYWYHS